MMQNGQMDLQEAEGKYILSTPVQLSVWTEELDRLD